MRVAPSARLRIGSGARLRRLALKNCRTFGRYILTLCHVGMLALAFAPLALGQTPSTKIYHLPRTLPLTNFYETPESLPAGKPGQLIRAEQFAGYRLSYEVSVYRILYHSASPQGMDVAVSGVVLMPEGTPPAGGWPIVAWAHDFTGSARECAPSLLKNLKEGPLLSMYTNAGYAVVATDYAGLGTNFPYADQDIRSNALDVIYSIPAARAALPQLGSKWVVAGYSQGAQVAVGVAGTAEAKNLAALEMGSQNLGAVRRSLCRNNEKQHTAGNEPPNRVIEEDRLHPFSSIC